MLQLSHKIRLKIQDGNDVIVDAELRSKKLTKKQQKEILELVDGVSDESTSEQLDKIEEVSKIRFNEQVSGAKKDMDAVRKVAEEYGYSIVLNQIDEQVQEKTGKQ